MYSSIVINLDQSIDNYGAMYDQIRHTPLARTSSLSDVTSSPQASTPDTPTTSKLLLEDTRDDRDYDRIYDCEEVIESEACWQGDPLSIRRRAMAEDFSEGKLETLVDSPQKENAGTQTQYVSYQVTTKVGTMDAALLLAVKLTSPA
jgi:sorting nexin-4